jgi:glycerophosphoryl diester phosphodiesterase
MFLLCATAAARGAQSYSDVVKADSPAQYFACDDGQADSATPLLNHASKAIDLVRKQQSMKVGDTFTVEFWQFVPTVSADQPVFQAGKYQIGVRSLPRKGKESPRAAFAATDKVALVPGNPASTKPELFSNPTTLASVGKWFHVAAVQADGKMLLYVNGYRAADVLHSAPYTGELQFAGDADAQTLIDEVAIYDHALPPERILAHFKAALPSRNVITVGHRGDNRGAPENTNVSYVQAIRNGTPIVEMDLRLTKDNVLILSHDATLDRCTNGKGPVVEKTLAELEQLDAGSWKDAKFKGEPIPTVETIGRTCRDKAVMMLDLKCEGLGESLAALKQKLNYPADQWILAPWTDEEGAALRKHITDVPMIRLTSKLPTDNFDDAYFAGAKQIGFSGYSVAWPALTQAFINAAHRNGFKVYCWTVNDTPDVAGSVLAGVDGIITDDAPSTMKQLAELTDRTATARK